MPEQLRCKFVTGYPAEGQLYKLYAMTSDGSYTRTISKPEEMVHSNDMIDISSGDWTKAPY